MKNGEMKVVTGNANRRLAEQIADQVGVPLARCTVSRFSDGEIQVKIDESVRGADVFIIQPTCAPVNEHLMELLIMLDAFRRASAARIVPVMPYYGYARQDKKVKPREPISAKLVADLLQQSGSDRIFAIDLHAGQVQGFFDIPVDHLPAGPILAKYINEKGYDADDLVVVSPDVGGVERATTFAEKISAKLAIIAKRRPEPNRSEVVEVIGDVKGKICVMVDDMIDTAGSITEGAKELERRGAAKILACCTHPVLSGPAISRLAEGPIEEVVVTDTIPLPPEKKIDKLTVLSVAAMVARAIINIHGDLSVSSVGAEYWRS